VLEALDLSGVQSQGYCFQIDMTYRTVEAGFRVAEVPIVFVERELGESKMSGSIISEAFTKVAGWGLTRRRNQLRRLCRSKPASRDFCLGRSVGTDHDAAPTSIRGRPESSGRQTRSGLNAENAPQSRRRADVKGVQADRPAPPSKRRHESCGRRTG
jgi:hypothetical protein